MLFELPKPPGVISVLCKHELDRCAIWLLGGTSVQAQKQVSPLQAGAFTSYNYNKIDGLTQLDK